MATSFLPDVEGVSNPDFDEEMTAILTTATPDQMLDIVDDACRFFEDKFGNTDEIESINNATIAITRVVRRLYVLSNNSGSYVVDRRNPVAETVGADQ